MTTKKKRKRVDPRKSADYLIVARQFHRAALDSLVFEYWTAASLLMVHAAIAYADAVMIRHAGEKSIGDDHEDAIDALGDVIGSSPEALTALKHLRRIVEQKNKVAYMGESYTPQQARSLAKHLDGLAVWANNILQ